MTADTRFRVVGRRDITQELIVASRGLTDAQVERALRSTDAATRAALEALTTPWGDLDECPEPLIRRVMAIPRGRAGVRP